MATGPYFGGVCCLHLHGVTSPSREDAEFKTESLTDASVYTASYPVRLDTSVNVDGGAAGAQLPGLNGVSLPRVCRLMMVHLSMCIICLGLYAVACPGILFGWGGSINSVEDRGQRERGSGGGSPLVRGSGGSCNLVQEISFHIVKFS